MYVWLNSFFIGIFKLFPELLINARISSWRVVKYLFYFALRTISLLLKGSIMDIFIRFLGDELIIRAGGHIWDIHFVQFIIGIYLQ